MGLTVLEDLHGRICRHPVRAEAQQSAALGAKGLVEESVLAARPFQI